MVFEKKLLKKTILIFIVWFIILFLIGVLAGKILPFKPRFPYAFDYLASFSKWQIVWHWANFDGPHYLTIAQKGYLETGFIQAYFPLFPIMVRLAAIIVANYLYSGLILNYLFFVLGLYFFQKLLFYEKIKRINEVLLFLLFFPTSFFFISFYTESLFFLLSVLTFLFIRKKRWFLAALTSGLASATRLVGIFVAASFLWDFFREAANPKKKNKIIFYLRLVLIFFLSLSGFFAYCLYLNKHFHHPFYFAKVQSAFGASRQTDKIILLYQVIWRYIKMMVFLPKNNFIFYAICQEFLISLFTLGLLLWALWKKLIKPDYLFYSFASYFLPTLTGNFSSMPRYLLSIFPIFLILSQIKSAKIKKIILLFSSVFLIINTILFVRGYWVA